MSKMLIPNKCGSCGSLLIWSETKTDLYCINPDCPAQLLYKIEYFLRTLGVEEVSATTLEKFNLTSIQDVYSLTEDYISSFDGFAEKKAKIIVNQIQKSLIDVSPAALIASFSIPGVGLKNGDKIYKALKKRYPDIQAEKRFIGFFKAPAEFFTSIEGLGDKLTVQILTTREKYIPLYKHLITRGMNFREEIKGKLTGEIVVMTGAAFDGRTRPSLENLILDNGGENGKGITKQTTLLIAENIAGSSSKLKKARDYGIRIITYSDFYNLIDLS